MGAWRKAGLLVLLCAVVALPAGCARDAGLVDDAGVSGDGSGQGTGHPDAGMRDLGVLAGPPRSCPAPVERVCTQDGWCRAWPGPGTGVLSMSALAPDDVWMGGEGGLLMHVQCDRFQVIPTPTTDDVQLVHAAAPDDVWVFLASGRVMRWDGGSLRDAGEFLLDNGAWKVAAGGAPSDFWVSTTDRDRWILRFDGHQLGYFSTKVKLLQQVVAPASNDVWALDPLGTPIHWDGRSFRYIPDPLLHGRTFRSLAARAPDDVWLLDGDNASARLVRWDGASFSSLEVPVKGALHLDTNGDGALFLATEKATLRWQEGSFVPATRKDGAPVAAGRLPQAGDYRFSAEGLSHWNGSAFELVDRGGSWPWAAGVWATGQEAFYYLPRDADGAILRYQGGAWRSVPLPGKHTWMAVGSPTDAWVFGDPVYHGDGTGFVATPLPDRLQPLSLSIVGTHDAWGARGDDQLLHFDGRAFALVPTGSGARLHQVFASRAGDVWALDSQKGTVFRSQSGGAFVAVPRPEVADAQGWSLFGIDDGEAWLRAEVPWGETGGALLLRARRGGSFEQITPEAISYYQCESVAGTRGDDVWIVGHRVTHYDGHAMTELPGGSWEDGSLRYYPGRNGDAWFASTSGAVLHWDGTSMVQQHTGWREGIQVLAAGFERPFLVGEYGTVLTLENGKP